MSLESPPVARLGIDLGGTKIEGVVLDAAGNTLAQNRIPTPQDDYRATVAAVAQLVNDLEMTSGITGTIGVGAPGAVSAATGKMKNCNSNWLNGRDLRRDLEAALGREIRLANDADCFTLSEASDGAGQEARSVFGVILGTGVGGGLVVDKKLLAGPNALAGEWGHNPMPWPTPEEWPGPPCYCSRTGCIETFLSGSGLRRGYGRAQATAEEIASWAAEGNSEAQAALACYEDRLARGLASVINIVDPEVIVLGGGLSKIDSLYESVPLLWRAYVFSDRVDTQLLPPRHGDSGGVRGAARLWI